MTAEQTRNHNGIRDLGRAVIESALEDDDRAFFLDPRSYFGVFVKAAELPAEELLAYVKQMNRPTYTKSEMRRNVRPSRVVWIETGYEMVFESISDVADYFNVSNLTVRLARRGAINNGHRIRTRAGFIEIYPLEVKREKAGMARKNGVSV